MRLLFHSFRYFFSIKVNINNLSQTLTTLGRWLVGGWHLFFIGSVLPSSSLWKIIWRIIVLYVNHDSYCKRKWQQSESSWSLVAGKFRHQVVVNEIQVVCFKFGVSATSQELVNLGCFYGKILLDIPGRDKQQAHLQWMFNQALLIVVWLV